VAEFTNQTIKFESDALDENALVVARLSGEERLSGLWRFDLELISDDPKIDLKKVLYEPARLGIRRDTADGKTWLWRHGVLAELIELEQGQAWTSYRAVLVPDMWKLTEFYRSRIFMDKTVDELAQAVLTDPEGLGVAAGDIEVKLARTDQAGDDPTEWPVYPRREYAVQYEETDYDFVARWLEHEGVFFYFENTGTAEKVVFGDSVAAYKPVDLQGATYPYHPEGAQSAAANEPSDEVEPEEVLAHACRMQRQPRTVALNDYNWRKPSTLLRTTKSVEGDGSGLQTEYNDHYKTDVQGEKLAEVRVQEWTCRAEWFEGRSTCRAFRPGRTFDLQGHFRSDFDQPYLLVEVRHEAEQAINLKHSTVTGSRYRNAFAAIPADRDFRPERVTPWPAIKGAIHARVDGEGGEHGAVDDLGRYRLSIPFDEYADADDRKGRATRLVRMAQPYAGPDAGFHFPLLEGTEVLLTHIDGDPDRPIIQSAVPNPDNVSPVHAGNASQNRFQTAGGNMFLFDDDADRTGIVITSGDGTYVEDHRLPGGPNDYGAGYGGGRLDPPAAAAAPAGPAPSAEAPSRAAEPAAAPAPEPGAEARASAPAGPAAAAADAPDRPRSRWFEQWQAARRGEGPVPTTNPVDPARARDAVRAFSQALPPLPPDVARRMLGPGRGMPVESTDLTETHSGLDALADDFDAIGAGLDKVRGKGASTAEPYVLSAKQYPNDLLILLGNRIKIFQHTDNYTYADISNDISFGTGGYGFHEEMGDTDDESIHIGDATSMSLHLGNSTSSSLSLGTSMSTSLRLGVDQSSSIFLGGTVSTSIVMSRDASMSIDIGTRSSIGLTIASSTSASITIGAATDTSIVLAANTSTGITLAAKSDTSITLGASTSTAITLAAAAETSITLAAKASASITLAAEASVSLTLAAKAALDLVIGGTAEIGIFIGGKVDVDIELAGKIGVEISLAQILKLDIAVGGKKSIDIAAADIFALEVAAAGGTKIKIGTGEKIVEIPSEDTVNLKDSLTTLQSQKTGLDAAITGLAVRLG